MRQRIKIRAWKIFKITWTIIGLIISSNALFWLVKKSAYTGAYFVTVAIFHAVAFFLLVIYLVISLVIILIKLFKTKYQNKK